MVSMVTVTHFSTVTSSFWGLKKINIFFISQKLFMLTLDRAIPHMKGLSEYFQNITSLKPSILSGNHGNQYAFRIGEFC